MTDASNRRPLRSLGLLSLGEIGHLFRNRRQELLELAGAIHDEDRPRLAAYLRGGAILFAAMEWTLDVLGDAFSTPGGSGIRTDGVYYWRRDCADYVEHYGIALPEEFLRHVEELGWTPPILSRDEVLALDRMLISQLRGT